MYVRIIPVRYDVTRTGCRVTVREEDYERVILESFWPDAIRVRDWSPRPRDNQGEGEEGARAPSDDDA